LTIYNAGDVVASRYEVVRYIDQGGMQEVYRARDQVLKRDIALKVPKNPSAQRRFERSAHLSASINHPNAARTLDYVEHSGRPHLIEEFIDGSDFRGIAERLPMMDPSLVAHVFHHLARGIAASHHVGVVHRDLKPSNIMTAGDLSFSFVKITDFGVAKMAEEEIAEAAKDEASITGSHTMIGALPYMAPEMIQNPRATGTPSDVWAIAAIAYELLSGARPFGTGLVAVPSILAGNAPAMPTAAGRTQFAPLGKELYDLLASCWIVDPVARPSADELVERCGDLCYGIAARRTGVVTNIMYSSYGFIGCDSGQVFFHTDSVYGPRPKIGELVCFSPFPGDPHPRAHPVIRMQAIAAVGDAPTA
jgi:eukaryotic-like serine/threonine-protein kinase